MENEYTSIVYNCIFSCFLSGNLFNYVTVEMLKYIMMRKKNIQNITFLALTVNLKKCKADSISLFRDTKKTLGKHPTSAYLSCSGNVHNCNVQFPLNEDKQICICYTYVSEVYLPRSLNVFNLFIYFLTVGRYQRHLTVIRGFLSFS